MQDFANGIYGCQKLLLFLGKVHNYLFVCWCFHDIQGTLIRSQPSIIELNQFANLIEKLILFRGGEGGGVKGGERVQESG